MYIEQAFKSLSDPWRYIVGIIVVFFAWQLFGGIPLIAALLMEPEGLKSMGGGDIGAMAEALGTNPFLFYMLLTFAIGLVCLFIWTKLVHKQPIKELTTSRSKVDWKRIFFAFILWSAVTAAMVLLMCRCRLMIMYLILIWNHF